MAGDGGWARYAPEAEARQVHASNGAPLFHQIAVILRDRIVSGELGPGARLPSEADICGLWNVSRITAKRALDTLAVEGLVARARGRGTTVLQRAHPPSATTRLDGWFENASRMAEATTIHVLSFGYRPAPAHVAKELDLAPGVEVQHARRVRRLDGRALSHLESWVPAEIGRRWTEQAMRATPLMRLLAEHGAAPATARQTISATTAPPDVAGALDMASGAALLDVRRRVVDASGRVVQFMRALYRPDLYRFEMELGRAEGEGGWRADPPPSPSAPEPMAGVSPA
ncbi:MAG: GntR family transcriptional regulator [Paracoccaceae bacterium]